MQCLTKYSINPSGHECWEFAWPLCYEVLPWDIRQCKFEIPHCQHSCVSAVFEEPHTSYRCDQFTAPCADDNIRDCVLRNSSLLEHVSCIKVHLWREERAVRKGVWKYIHLLFPEGPWKSGLDAKRFFLYIKQASFTFYAIILYTPIQLLPLLTRFLLHHFVHAFCSQICKSRAEHCSFFYRKSVRPKCLHPWPTQCCCWLLQSPAAHRIVPAELHGTAQHDDADQLPPHRCVSDQLPGLLRSLTFGSSLFS